MDLEGNRYTGQPEDAAPRTKNNFTYEGETHQNVELTDAQKTRVEEMVNSMKLENPKIQDAEARNLAIAQLLKQEQN